MNPFQQKENSPDFTNPAIQQAFVQDAHNAHALLQKELVVNRAEQTLLEQRIRIMKEFVNDLPTSDPHYSMMRMAIQMDEVERDELKSREAVLFQRISSV